MSKNKLNPLSAIWEQVPPDYYYQQNFLQKLWHEWKWLVIKHLLQKNSAPRKILDIGCNSGYLTSLIARTFPQAQVTGVDVDGKIIKEARKRHLQIKYLEADAHELPFADDQFDVVVISETIEHVRNPSQVLAEIARVLKKGGQTVIEMDSGSWLFRFIWFFWSRWGKGKVWKHAHLHPFKAWQLENLIKRCNFDIQEKIASHFGMAITFLAFPKKQTNKD